jgi:myo-inositol-1(or 4)-monophosphatase
MLTLLQTAQEAARIGGRILQQWQSKFTAKEKSPANLVTEADLASQEAIHEFIRMRFPDHKFLGEEGLDQQSGNSEYRWVIDPLDGTGNYVHRFPYYAVSIGLEHQGELVVGVIYDPTRDEMFSAMKGSGALLNGSPLRCSEVEKLSEAMCMASLPVKTSAQSAAVNRFLKVLTEAQSVQRSGSAALNLCYVASGRVDAFWSTSLMPWDMAAGVLIVREAGGRVTQTGGGDFRLEVPDLLATNGSALHPALSKILSE